MAISTIIYSIYLLENSPWALTSFYLYIGCYQKFQLYLLFYMIQEAPPKIEYCCLEVQFFIQIIVLQLQRCNLLDAEWKIQLAQIHFARCNFQFASYNVKDANCKMRFQSTMSNTIIILQKNHCTQYASALHHT